MSTDDIAFVVSRNFGDDGLCFYSENGYLEDVCIEKYKAIREINMDLVRYVFPDGSAIVVSGSAWDIEGPEEWSWLGS